MQKEKLPGREQVTLRLADELHRELEIIGKETGLTITALLIISIWHSVLMPVRKLQQQCC